MSLNAVLTDLVRRFVEQVEEEHPATPSEAPEPVTPTAATPRATATPRADVPPSEPPAKPWLERLNRNAGNQPVKLLGRPEPNGAPRVVLGRGVQHTYIREPVS